MTKAPQPDAPFRFQLDLRSGVPVYRQIMDQVLAGIASGRLSSGDQLPTVRQMAVDLQINPNTVIRAYRELEIRGFLDLMWMSLINGQLPPEQIERELLPLVWRHDEREDALDCSYFERGERETDIKEISDQIRLLLGRLGRP